MAKRVRVQAWIYFALIGNVCDNGVCKARLNPAHDGCYCKDGNLAEQQIEPVAKRVRVQAWIYFALIGNVCDNGVCKARLNPASDATRLGCFHGCYC